MIDLEHPGLSVREQCRLLGLHRANLYYEPVSEPADNLQLMRLIDEEYLRHPFYGSRRMENRTPWEVYRSRRTRTTI